MDLNLEIFISFILYLAFFAWIGANRGMLRELIVLITSVIGWIALRQQGNIFADATNLLSVGVTFLKERGLGSSFKDAALTAFDNSPKWITDTNQGAFTFILWVALVVLAYFICSKFVKKSIGNIGWAMLVGIVNGLFLTSIFLPRLAAILIPKDTNYSSRDEVIRTADVSSIFRGIRSVLLDGFQSLWRAIDGPQLSIIFLVLITLLLVIAANTLRSQE